LSFVIIFVHLQRFRSRNVQNSNQDTMRTTLLSAEVNISDVPMLELLLKRIKAKKIVFEEETIDEYEPNETTLNAMKEIEAMKNDKNTIFFDNTEELLSALKS